MAALTVVALAAVGFLTYQAAAGASDLPARGDRPGASASPSPGAGEGGDGPGKGEQESTEAERPPVPAGSGTGLRVVYSLKAERVWLVGEDEQPTRTYPVWPSALSPAPGEYAVVSRSESVTGSDGVPIEHSVIFTSAEGTVIGFSAAADGSKPRVGEGEPKTGGIRSARKDASAMWTFAPVGTKVVVVR
ncbi:L,D-transpeptidase [Streptomyces sp. PLAI1-29]|uniref:L,D-transpeptidase n=1 Tax=Streptomyces zingiberis TaxID=2053010 RepID=A0ABX1C063_9ACTN|nr:L,D-transpeptidase [Streptomyces zingiberis]